MPGFAKPLRFDRPGNRQGGGVAILYKEGLDVTDLGGAEIDKCEIQLAEVKINNKKSIRLAAVYCPNSKIPLTDKAFKFIKSLKGMLLCGDFNAHHPELGTRRKGPDDSGTQIVKLMRKHNLRLLSSGQHTFTSRSSGAKEALDLYIASEDVAKLVSAVEVLPDVGSDHLPVMLTIRTSASLNVSFPEVRLDLIKANWDRIGQQLHTDCADLALRFTGTKDIDEGAAKLGSILLEAQNLIPTCPANQLKSWNPSRIIIEAIKTRRIARRVFERFRSPESRRLYNVASKRVKLLIQAARLERF